MPPVGGNTGTHLAFAGISTRLTEATSNSSFAVGASICGGVIAGAGAACGLATRISDDIETTSTMAAAEASPCNTAPALTQPCPTMLPAEMEQGLDDLGSMKASITMGMPADQWRYRGLDRELRKRAAGV
jgi:hypothetical protein